MANPIDALRWAWEHSGRHNRVGKHQERSGPRFNKMGVLHTTENSLVRSSAEGVADWQNRQTGHVNMEATKKRYSGYHFLVDRNGFIGQCNPSTTRAYHAGNSYDWGDRRQPTPYGGGGGNNHIGVAMVARASKMPYNEEAEAFDGLLTKTATLLAHIKDKYAIPLVRLTIAEYRAGHQGWLGHQDVATPHGRKSDPGEHFPWDELLKQANARWANIYAAPKPPQAATSGQPKPLSFSAGNITLSGQTFKADEVKFLKDFAHKSLYSQVEAGSLAYATAVIRRLRIELGVEPDITASELAVRIAGLLKKGRNIG